MTTFAGRTMSTLDQNLQKSLQGPALEMRNTKHSRTIVKMKVT